MMPGHTATERELWRRALAANEDCPTIEELGRLSEGSIPQGAVVRTHLAGCARCQTELAMLREFQSATTGAQEAGDVSWITAELERRFGRTRGAAPLPSELMQKREPPPWWDRLFGAKPLQGALALAALLVLIVLGLQLPGAQEPELSSNTVNGPVVLRSEELVALRPTGDLHRIPSELQWQATPGAVRYLVKVMEVDRTELWKTESGQTSVSLPAVVRARIVPGKTLLWQVIATDSAGRTVATSQVLRFRLGIGPASSKK
jgi:hypothetical protein